MAGRCAWWPEEIARAEATLALIRACVAPSPRREAWIARTEAALALLRRYHTAENEARGRRRIVRGY